MIKKYSKFFILISVAFDVGAIFLAYYLAFYLREHVSLPFTAHLLPKQQFKSIKHYYLLIFISHILFFYVFDIYDRRLKKDFWEGVKRVFLPCLISTLILISFYFFSGNINFPRSVLVLFVVLAVLITSLWRRLLAIFDKPVKSKVIIAGLNLDSINLIEALKTHYSEAVTVLGVVVYNLQEKAAFLDDTIRLNVPVLGEIQDVKKIIKGIDFNEMIITPKDPLSDQYIDEISRGKGRNVSLYALPSAYEVLLGKLKHTVVHDIPMVEIKHSVTMEGRFVKRIFDILFSATLLILSSPFLIITAILIKLTSRGPVFFTQTRIGRGGSAFVIYKFRSMIVDAETEGGAQLATENDNRVTPIGRFIRSVRIDELPQLFNVLKGEMSVVGPRPERKEFVKDFIKNIPAYRERLHVKPGATGLAQIKGGYHTNARIKLKYDLSYIANHSFWLDLKIIFETVKVVFTRKGV